MAESNTSATPTKDDGLAPVLHIQSTAIQSGSIDLPESSIYKPWFVLGNLGNSAYQQLYQGDLHNRLEFAKLKLKRGTTDEETQALVDWTGDIMALRTKYYQFGALLGLAQAYNTRETYRFPRYTPSKKFKPDVLAFGGKIYLKGNGARVFWHAARGTAYLGLGGLVGVFVGDKIGKWRMFHDPRLNELRMA